MSAWSGYLAGVEPGRAKQGSVPLVIPRDGPRSIAVCPPWGESWCSALMLACTLAERPGVDRFEAEPVDQLRRFAYLPRRRPDRNTKPLGVSQ
jgi:hypothetical protein